MNQDKSCDLALSLERGETEKIYDFDEITYYFYGHSLIVVHKH